MPRTILMLLVIACMTLFCATSGRADVPAPPVNQTLGMNDVLTGDQTEAVCRVCHASGVPDRHHMLYGQPIPAGTLVPFPDADGDGVPDTIYSCLNCHGQNFTVVRDCLACHNAGSPHHTTPAAVDLNCPACHGGLVNSPYDGHYVPSYSPSLVTPYRGLNGDGYENSPFPTPDLASDGSGTVVPGDFTTTEAGPPFFTVTAIGPLGTLHTRNEPAQLKFKPAGTNNDVVIGSTHHGGEEYNVVFTAGSPLAASWNPATQTLSVTLDTTQTALDLVNAINTATGTTDVEAELGYDGEDPSADLLASTHYEPLGGDPANSRGFGAGSCSYCHDNDGNLDANGDPEGPIWDNHTLHHGIGLPFMVSDGAGGTVSRCDVCHERATAGEQSGPNFNFAIRHCERCHGPESLHNIQADSPNTNNIGTLVVGGEDAGYGHVGRDAGPGDSDCWGCHGFATASAPDTGPIVPHVAGADSAVIGAGADAAVTLVGSAFTNVTNGTQYASDVTLTAGDGSSVTLTPDLMNEGTLGVTIPADTAPGNYDLRAVKADIASNPAAISITPKVVITGATGDATVTITGSGFAGYAEGSGTSVTGTITTGKGKKNRTTTTVEAEIVSWSNTAIEAAFDTRPNEVTVNSVFGTASSEVSGDGGGGGGKPPKPCKGKGCNK